MKAVADPSELWAPGKRFCLAIGVFDGVHLGHQTVLRKAAEAARAEGAEAAAVTFDRHPNEVTAPDRAPPMIQRLEERLAWIAAQGVEAAWVIPFDAAFSRLSGEAFVELLLRRFRRVQAVFVGERFLFGHRRSGSAALLRELGRARGFAVEAVPAVRVDGRAVSSTLIRGRIRAGDLAEAERLLGHCYCLGGRVVHGDRLGRRIGFPTANLDPEKLALPPWGVYAAWAREGAEPKAPPEAESEAWRKAALHIGPRPTVEAASAPPRLEAHLIGFRGNLYGRWLSVRPIVRLRGERSFDSLEALKAQIDQDVAQVEKMLQDRRPGEPLMSRPSSETPKPLTREEEAHG